MPVAWFVGPFRRNDTLGHGRPTRVTFIREALEGQQVAINYRCAEVLGNHAVCKVRAGDAVLDAIAALPGVDRVNKDLLDDPLSDLPPAAQQRLRDIAQTLGYTLAEINARFPNPIGTYTLGDVLRFFGKRWRAPRWNGTTIAFDTPDRDPPTTVDALRVDEVAK